MKSGHTRVRSKTRKALWECTEYAASMPQYDLAVVAANGTFRVDERYARRESGQLYSCDEAVARSVMEA